MLNTSRIATNK